jgi:hypothetical protein
MGPFTFIPNRKRAAVTCTAMLGPASRALPAIPSHLGPGVSALLPTVRVVPFATSPFASSGRILRQRRENAAVAHPSPLAGRDLTGARLEPPPVMYCLAFLLVNSIMMILIDSAQPGPNARYELLPEADARHERTLEAVSSIPLLDG